MTKTHRTKQIGEFFQNVAIAEGWTSDQQLDLLLDYIATQTGPDGYEAFVEYMMARRPDRFRGTEPIAEFIARHRAKGAAK